ncbi:MAG: hypothetical protein ACFFD4_08180 [Candidatus Odinarchaeota archaeon]
MNTPDIVIFGFQVPAVTLVLLAEALLIVILSVIDLYLTRGARKIGVDTTPGKQVLIIEIFFSFLILSAVAEFVSASPDDIILILFTLIIFGFFIKGYGITNLQANAYFFLAAVAGSLLGPLLLHLLGMI